MFSLLQTCTTGARP